VDGEGGSVNKFVGDAALCVFGAPLPHDDPAGGALRAARRLRERLAAEVPQCDVGIGVSAGTAVAGNIGAQQRFACSRPRRRCRERVRTRRTTGPSAPPRPSAAVRHPPASPLRRPPRPQAQTSRSTRLQGPSS
jgi:hypothetical protein